MRKLNRENRPQAEKFVKDGGQSLQNKMIQPKCYEVTMLHSPEHFFMGTESNGNNSDSSKIDGSNPILILLKDVD